MTALPPVTFVQASAGRQCGKSNATTRALPRGGITARPSDLVPACRLKGLRGPPGPTDLTASNFRAALLSDIADAPGNGPVVLDAREYWRAFGVAPSLVRVVLRDLLDEINAAPGAATFRSCDCGSVYPCSRADCRWPT